ncbi:hypothetical protein MJO28_016791 [Puccinia striiformis f. sp. tritici]|nr:hypothetical protein MJO28_016791 [Puccinia striiformis f. sp. tritici]
MKTQALPSVDVSTLWNSTYLMLKLSLPYKDAFDNLAIQDANYTDCPTSTKWEELATMRVFSTQVRLFSITVLIRSEVDRLPFLTATLQLGKTHLPTAHIIFKTMKKINKQLQDAKANGPPHLSKIIEPMRVKCNKYWIKMRDFAAINKVFDPRCKLERLEFTLGD